jgi:hypothetical protein
VIRLMDERYQQRWEAQEKAVAVAFVAQEKAVTAALTSAQQAVDKAEIANEKRLQGVNEFRAQLADQATRFALRDQVSQQVITLNDKIESTNKQLLDKIDFNTGSFTARIDDLKTYKDSNSGKSQGLSTSWGILLGGISILSVLANMFLMFKKG